MPSTNSKSAFYAGCRTALPFLLILGPFGLLFGVVATEAGMSLAQTIGFSMAVIAGAAQFTAVQLMQDQAPMIIVLASALAVNLRMAMYAAALAPHIGHASLIQRLLVSYGNFDASFAMAMAEYEANPDRPIGEKVGYFLGSVAVIIPSWAIATFLGAQLGALIPESFGLDFALPILFLSFVAPALRSLAHVAAAFTSVILAIVLQPVPYNLWILIAGIAAMIVGAEVERRMTRP